MDGLSTVPGGPPTHPLVGHRPALPRSLSQLLSPSTPTPAFCSPQIHWLTPFCQTPLRKQKLPDCSVITSAVWPASAQDAASLWVRLMTRPLALDPHPKSPSQALALASATPPNSMSIQIFGSLQLKNKAKPLFLDHLPILSTA